MERSKDRTAGAEASCRRVLHGPTISSEVVQKRKISASLDLESPEEAELTTVCSQCDKPETQCTCEKYCCFCQSQQDVRLCIDGLYYCPDCREACDVRLADSNDS